MVFAFQLIILVALAGSFALWGAAFRRIARKQPLLPRLPRPPAPWGLIDLLLATLVLMTFQLLNALVLTKVFGIDPGRGWENASARDLTLVLFCEPVANLTAIATAVLAIGLRTGARAADFGVSLRDLRQDLRLGTVAFVMLAPLVYGLQWLLVIWFPYEHPLIRALEKHPEALVHGAVFFSAVVGAPLVEEFFYRVLWQGGLQAFVPRRGDFWHFVFGSAASPVAISGGGVSAGSESGQVAMGHQASSAEVFAILVSSALFALMHVSQGAAPIPLFVLALGLGYMYARTVRVLPCIVVHVWLNAWSLVTLWIGAVAG